MRIIKLNCKVTITIDVYNIRGRDHFHGHGLKTVPDINHHQFGNQRECLHSTHSFKGIWYSTLLFKEINLQYYTLYITRLAQDYLRKRNVIFFCDCRADIDIYLMIRTLAKPNFHPNYKEAQFSSLFHLLLNSHPAVYSSCCIYNVFYPVSVFLESSVKQSLGCQGLLTQIFFYF